MTPRIFVYVGHKNGIADDCAVELLAAAKTISPITRPTAVVAGCGPEFDRVCESLRSSYGEVWKLAHDNLAYPNAELIRKALLKVLPSNNIVLVPHGRAAVRWLRCIASPGQSRVPHLNCRARQRATAQRARALAAAISTVAYRGQHQW